MQQQKGIDGGLSRVLDAQSCSVPGIARDWIIVAGTFAGRSRLQQNSHKLWIIQQFVLGSKGHIQAEQDNLEP